MVSNPFPLHNSGLVLLNQYFPILFERLGLTQDNNFVSDDAQKRAVVWLHYLVTGLTQASEQELVLNKALCGLPINASIDSNAFQLAEQEKELVDGLLNAAISHWPAIGSSSVDGFRGNWLVREGVLQEEEDRLGLAVTKRIYDLLLDQSPYSFSIVRYAWMEKILYVDWR